MDVDHWDFPPSDLYEVRDGLLYIMPKVSNEEKYIFVPIHADKVDNKEFSAIEIRAALESGFRGSINFGTQCISTKKEIAFQLSAFTNEFAGEYKTGEVWENLNWDKSLSMGTPYIIRLEKFGDAIRVLIDGVELPTSYPCDSMGEWFNMGAGRNIDGYVQGYIDYVKIWFAP
jgi:hypothetical protein